MTDIFISYSRRDKEFVQVLHDALLASKYDAWIDWQDIAPTTEWWKEIEAGIEAAHTFIFVISKDSIESRYCRKEIDHAIKHGKRLVPILHRRDFDRADMHPKLGQHQWVVFREEDNFNQSFTTLVETINADLEYKKTHTRLELRAIEWLQSKRDKSLLIRGKDLSRAQQWLLSSAGKEPAPTKLQGEYIAASRQAAKSSKRNIMLSLGSLLMLTLFGIGVAFWQFKAANRALAESFWRSSENSLSAGRAADEVGESVQAEEAFYSAFQDAKAAAERFPAGEMPPELIQTLNESAVFYAWNRMNKGDISGAETVLIVAESFSNQYVGDRSPELIRSIAFLENALARLFSEKNEDREALAYQKRAVDLAREAATLAPENVSLQRTLAGYLENISNTPEPLISKAEAEDYQREGCSVARAADELPHSGADLLNQVTTCVHNESLQPG